MWTAIKAWLEDHELALHNIPHDLEDLIARQQQAGWEQLLLGRFVKEWKLCQDDYLREIGNQERKYSGRSWVTGVTTIIWDQVYNNWEERNNDRHGSDRVTQEGSAQYDRKTEELYALQDQVLARDRPLFYSNMDKHCAREPTARGKRQWLENWKPVILRSVRRDKELGIQNVRSITSYFTQLTTNNN